MLLYQVPSKTNVTFMSQNTYFDQKLTCFANSYWRFGEISLKKTNNMRYSRFKVNFLSTVYCLMIKIYVFDYDWILRQYFLAIQQHVFATSPLKLLILLLKTCDRHVRQFQNITIITKVYAQLVNAVRAIQTFSDQQSDETT